MSKVKIKIYPNWYKIDGIWHHCVSFENGETYVDGNIQLEHRLEVEEDYNAGIGIENEQKEY